MATSGIRLFATVTFWVTLLLFAFTLWISGGATLGKVIAAGVLFFGLVQWLVLRRIGHQMAAKADEGVEPDGPSR
ncbi:MAG: hypothetical protein WBF53_13210 [Litorimonas sp.]